MSRARLLAILPVLAWSTAAFAQQPASLTGLVQSQTGGRPVSGAEVRLDDAWLRVDRFGRFHAGSVPAGGHTLSVRAVGFQPQARRIEVLPGHSQHLVINLVPAIVRLDSLEIIAAGPAVLAGDELAARGSDLTTALNGWEGVVVTRGGAGNEATARIRGSAADEVLVLLDGYPLNDPYTGRADLSRVPLRDVQQVSLQRGTQTARSGHRAIAGVIEIRTHPHFTPAVSVGAGSGGSAAARVAGGAGSMSAALSVEVLPRDYMVDHPGGGEVRRGNAGGETWNLYGKGRPGFDLTVRGSASNRGLPGTIVNPTPHAAVSDRSLVITGRTGTRTWLGGSLELLDTRAADSQPPPGFIAYRSHTWGTGATVDAGLDRGFSVGGWHGTHAVSIALRQDRFGGDGVQRDASFSRAGGGWTARVSRPGPVAWTLAPSLRLDWYTGADRPRLTGKADVQFAAGGTTITAGLGNGLTVPALADLLFREGVGIAVNPDLRPERVRWEAEAAVSRAFRLGAVEGSVRAGGYYGIIDDMVLWSPNFRFVWSPGNFGVRRRGAEAQLALNHRGGITLTASAGYNWITYLESGSNVPYRPRISAAVQATWLAGAWHSHLGWNYLGERFTRNRGSSALPGFGLVTLAAGRRVGIMTLQGEIRDLLDTRPVYIAGFPAVGRTVHLSLGFEFP